MFKKIKINKDKCIGCGTCAALAPDVFDLDDSINNPKAFVKSVRYLDDKIIDMVKDSCPTEAIEIEK